MTIQDQYYQVFSEQNQQYMMTFTLDFYSKRIRVDDYRGNIMLIVKRMSELAIEHDFAKALIKAREADWRKLVSIGFVLEGVLEGFFSGDDAYSMAQYFKMERRVSDLWEKEDQILLQILQQSYVDKESALTDRYQLRLANREDCEQLSALYKTVFPVYPTPLNQAQYVEHLLQTGSIFYVVEYDQEIVSAASAHVNMLYYNAEIADCATLPAHQKKGLMKILIEALEAELVKRSIFTSFSHARAQSYGMNTVFHQLHYRYNGRMVNNCVIFQALEDLNVWTKNLSNS